MIKKIAFLGTAMVMATAMAAPAAAQFNSALNEARRTQDEAKASQQRVERLDDETSAILGEYRANLKQFELLTRFNETRRAEIESQGQQIGRIQEDLENVSTLQLAMVPLMEDMLDNLEAFINADMPFNETERQDRLARLRRMMADSEVSAAQRYRLIVEAYQIENEFGRTVDTYEGEVDTPEGALAVEFLRIGRTALVYKNADDSILRIYDRDTGDFVDLDKSFLEDVRFGLRVAKEQTAPDLLTLPVKAPIQAQ
ncbi:DUF3450 domain-containing protein [Parvularcula sp. IMCC14364]|uniref:DUF3450 domain-containing protein n=1 Tax=Parvularcula sp. IMCC14364 TaxID=3067902 RepID=UPI002740B7C4|nr:DUF3450 domain-containing protein [Parvularcula sp. IMCC14364]